MMRPFEIAAVLVVTGAPVPAWGADVIVLDPDAHPVPETAVLCTDGGHEMLLTDAEGRVTMSDRCRRVTCLQGSYFPGAAVLEASVVTCRLGMGVNVLLTLDPPGCGEPCYAVLRAVDGDGIGESRELTPDAGSGVLRSRLGPAKPGLYDVLLTGAGWICSSRDNLRQHEEAVHAQWRFPVEVVGVVLDAAGRPMPDVPVRVRESHPQDLVEPGAWRCARDDDALDRFSARDGTFHVTVDPERPAVIEAGSSWDPDGFGTLKIAPPFPPSVVVHLHKQAPS